MTSIMQTILKILAVFWAAPTSLVGLVLLVPFGRGARVRCVQGALEVWGPGIESMFQRFSPNGAQAMALGHLVLGTKDEVLAAVRRHERVHVRQAECCGPLFLPLYLGASLWLYLLGKDWYRNNPFEVQAYSRGGDGDWPCKNEDQNNSGYPLWPLRWFAFGALAAIFFLASASLFPKAEKFPPGYARHMNRGVMALEQFDYATAAEEYRLALGIRPGDLPARVNLGISLLNLATDSGLDEAIAVLSGVRAEKPNQPWATYSLGMILQYRNNLEGALTLFRTSTDIEPEDPHSWYQLGKCLMDLDGNPRDSLAALEKALDLEPALNAARYALAMHPLTTPNRRTALLDEQQALIKANWEREYSLRYIEMGRFAEAMPWDTSTSDPGKPAVELLETSPTGNVGPDAFSIVCVNLGGKEYLLSDGPEWQAFRLPDWNNSATELGLNGIGGKIFSVADVNNDGIPDIVFARDGFLGIMQGVGDGAFRPVAAIPKQGGVRFVRAVDIDQDGDLDLILSLEPVDSEGSSLALWINSGESPPGVVGQPPSGMSWKFTPHDQPVWRTGCLWATLITADVDGDGDLDIVLVPAKGSRVVQWIRNDRLLRFQRLQGPEIQGKGELLDGLALSAEPGSPSALFLVDAGGAHVIRFEPSRDRWQTDPFPWRARGPLLRRDLDDDGRPDLLSVADDGSLEFLSPARADRNVEKTGGIRLVSGHQWRLITPSATSGHLWGVDRNGSVASIRIGVPGGQKLMVRPTGKRETNANLRTNPDAVGCLVGILAGNVRGWDQVGNGCSGVQSAYPITLGTGKNPVADAVRLRWPDAVPQAEPDLPAGSLHHIAEKNRKGTSCPVIFVHAEGGKLFVTDCLGGGALGEQGPDGTVRPARPVETVLLPTLKPVNGRFVVELSEPMDELMYLDHARLLVVDHPSGTEAIPDERFAMSGEGPSGRIVVLDRLMNPVRASVGGKEDCARELSWRDGLYASGFRPRGWLGYAEEHSTGLEFPVSQSGPLALVMVGGVDYPYPESILAATQAGVELMAPVLEKRTDKGWIKICDVGFPAGLPKTMLAPLPAETKGGDPWRLRSNMQVHWDQIRLGRVLGSPEQDSIPGVSLVSLAPATASLEVVGYYRENQANPLVSYDPSARDPVSAHRWRGAFTKPGVVMPLVAQLDDRVVVCGPGRSVRLEFDSNLPAVGHGTVRSYMLRVHGWCKDASTTTRTGGQVDPLPTR